MIVRVVATSAQGQHETPRWQTTHILFQLTNHWPVNQRRWVQVCQWSCMQRNYGLGGGEERHNGCRAAHAHVYRGRAESRHWTELQTRASFVDMKISWSLGLVNWLQSLLRDLSGASEWVADINMNSRAQLINEFLNADRARTEHWKTTWQEPLVSKWDELLYLALIENFTETPDFHKHRFPWVCKALINWWTTVSQTQVFVL